MATDEMEEARGTFILLFLTFKSVKSRYLLWSTFLIPFYFYTSALRLKKILFPFNCRPCRVDIGEYFSSFPISISYSSDTNPMPQMYLSSKDPGFI